MASPVFPLVEKLVHNGDAMDKFNIVVLGDGFQQPELDVFDAYADLIAVRLLNLKPFDAVANRINVWKVSTPSVDSGVTFAGAPRNTHYGIAGNWNNEGYAGYFGTPHPERVIAAAALAAPEQAPGLRILIVNHDGDGGRGSNADRTVFVPLFKVDLDGDLVPAAQRKRDFVQTTAHECGHAIANLAEEYISCNEHSLGEPHANQQTPEDTSLDPVVKWHALALPRELTPMGQFKAVHEVGDRMTRRPGEPISPVVAPAFTGMLGRYWGCMDIDPNLKIRPKPAPGDCNEADQRGAPFHRPMARCRMRHLDFEFCRVCASELKRIIVQSTV